MPKKKTGQRKKAEKQRLLQKEIRTAFYQKPLAEHPCNAAMEVKNLVLSVCDADEYEIRSSLITSNSDNVVKETPARSMSVIHDDVEWDAAWSLLHLADFAPSETTALPKQTSLGDRSSASLKESHSNVNKFTTPNSIMASNSSVHRLSVNPHQHGHTCLLAPTSNTSYASSITSTSKPFRSDSIVQVASSTTKNISKPHLVSPLALVSPETMVGVSHSKAGKSLNNNAVISDMIIPQGSSGILNLSQSPVKGNSVLSGNMTVAVKNNLSTNSVAACASHSKMIATIHVSKAHSQVIQPSLASSIITQGALPKQTSLGDRSSASLKESHINVNKFTTPNSIMASNSSVHRLSVNPHQHGHTCLLAPTSNTSYASSITSTSKPFRSDSIVQVASSTTKNISKPHLVSPLALVSSETMVGVSHSKAGKSLNNNAVISDMIIPQGSSGILNLSQSPVKGNPVLSGNMTVAVKNNLSTNSVATCASHSKMIATIHVSKAHSQVIQPSLASSIITQGALPKQTSLGDRSSASLKESHSNVNKFTTPNSIMASNSSVHRLSVNPHQHGHTCLLAPTSNTSYASSITSTSKPFRSDSIVQVASSTTKNISKPHLVSPLALVSSETMVGVSHSKAGKSLNNNAVISDMIIPQGSSGILNLSQSPVKGNSVLSGNMTVAVKNNLSTNSVAACASHSKMIATIHVSKAHSQVIQPSLASSIITQGALPKQTSLGDRSSASLKESHSNVNKFTTPNSIMASNSSVHRLSVNPHQHGHTCLLAPTSNTSYASSITSTSKPFRSDSIVQVASSTTKNISKPHLVSPLALVSSETMVGVSHSKAGKSLNNNAVISDMIIPQGSSGILNLSQSPVKGNSVLSGNMTVAVKNNLSTNSVAACASHSKMIATIHVSKAHSQVIQPSLASSIITQGEVASPSSAKASTSKNPQIPTVKKKDVKFSIASIYYFNRTQGFTSVPSRGGCTLGMEKNHTHMEILSVENYGKKNIINSQRKKPSPVLLSDGNEDSTEESNDLPVCELEVTCETFKPLTVDERRALLRASGVQTIDASEKRECDFIRSSRQNCGCECKTTCDPDRCSCSNLGIKCQVEVFSFPCGCSHDSCRNPNGRYEYDGNKVQNHLKNI